MKKFSGKFDTNSRISISTCLDFRGALNMLAGKIEKYAMQWLKKKMDFEYIRSM